VYGLVAASYFDLPAGPFLRWLILPALPTAAAAAVLAGIVVWRPDPPGGSWLIWLRFPLVPIVLAWAGMVLVERDMSTTPAMLTPLVDWLERLAPPASPVAVIGPTGRIGAAGIGAAIGLLVVHRIWYRLLVVPLLALATAATVEVRTAGIIGVGLAIAAGGWWWWRVAQLVVGPLLADAAASATTAPVNVVPVPADEPAAGGNGPPDHLAGATRAALPAPQPLTVADHTTPAQSPVDIRYDRAGVTDLGAVVPPPERGPCPSARSEQPPGTPA
jgi:hypothetical protein